MLVDTCDACRFDADDYRGQDATGTLRAAAPIWRYLVDGLADEVLVRRADGGWSVADHAARARDLTVAMGDVLAASLGDAPPVAALDLPDPPSGEEPVRAIVDWIQDASDRIRATAGLLAGDGWRRPATVDGRQVDAGWVLRQAVHANVHHVSAAGRALHAAGAGAARATGSVAQVSVSSGGVPKLAIDEGRIGRRGVAGDRQAARRHHGRAWQALCLWSLERIEALRAEGHSVVPGAAGENVTVAGVDWSAIRPGTRLALAEALVEVTAYATPCQKNARWFADGDPNRMLHDRHPGWSRVYASVLVDGTVRAGDTVVVEP